MEAAPKKAEILQIQIRRVPLSPEQIVRGVCRDRSISVDVLRGPSQAAYHVSARRAIVKELRAAWPLLSLVLLAGYVGRKDHTTAQNLLRREDPYKPRNPEGRRFRA